MPITAWLCTGCGGREVDLLHFETTDCGNTVCHPDMARAVYQGRVGHYAQGVVEVSHGLGCPRSYAIQHAENYAVDPLTMNAMETGTAWHAHMEKHSTQPALCEVKVEGFIAGIRVVGKFDRIRDGVIEDHKHTNDFSRKWMKEPKPTHMAQISLYAELAAQSGMDRPTHGRVWYHFSGQGKDATMPFTFEIWALDQVLAYRPGAYTILDLLKQANAFFVQKRPWAELPLVGETVQYGQKTACSYCSVFGICRTQAIGAPF